MKFNTIVDEYCHTLKCFVQRHMLPTTWWTFRIYFWFFFYWMTRKQNQMIVQYHLKIRVTFRAKNILISSYQLSHFNHKWTDKLKTYLSLWAQQIRNKFHSTYIKYRTFRIFHYLVVQHSITQAAFNYTRGTLFIPWYETHRAGTVAGDISHPSSRNICMVHIFRVNIRRVALWRLSN